MRGPRPPCSIVCGACSSPDFPRVRGVPTAMSRPPAAGHGVRRHRPRQGRRRRRRRGGARAPAQAGRRAGHPRPRRPHVVRRARGRSLRRHRLDPLERPSPADRPDGRDVARDDRRCSLRRRTTQWAEPDDVQELDDAQELELAGLRFTVDHTPGHTEGSVTFRLAVRRRRRVRGDVLRRPAVRGLDRAHRPARWRPPDDAAQPARQGAAAAPTTSSCCPGTASRPRSAASAPPTRSCSSCRPTAPRAPSAA